MADCLSADRVAGFLRAMRRRAGLSPEALASGISDEVGERFWGPQVSRWELGEPLPSADVLLAAQLVCGVLAVDLEMAPRSGVRPRPQRRPRRNEIALPDAVGSPAEYVYVQEAAEMLDLSRPSFYHFMATGVIQGYRIGKRTAFRIADVSALVRRRASAGRQRRAS